MSTNPTPAMGQELENTRAQDYLSSFLDKNLRIHVSDGRMFVGQMKCTDRESNYVLGNAHEYREPTPKQVKEATERAVKGHTSVILDMNCRYVGLIVVPGEHIRKIEVEEFDPSLIS
ncbi:hypothetical protein FH972_021165 [Carpinus fangiana]|uniref:Sm domain-containing protein n=1 Tax=Carpinus fangiana TaxID=176857 RepID=A0A5N6KQP8_9ROSI|nr:hypothetical protein FH972_021165 [Carpinus fangiana]